MPRTSGQYNLPPAFPFNPGTVISSTDMNAILLDIAAALTDSYPKDGSIPMTAPIKNVDGTLTLPAYGFNSDASLGIYREGPGALSFAANGSKMLSMTNATVAVTNALTVGGTTALTGATTITGATTLVGGASITNGQIELGSTTTVGSPYIDFHSSGTANDYDFRIVATGGTTNGTGALELTGGSLKLSAPTTAASTFTASGATTLNGVVTVNGVTTFTAQVNGITKAMVGLGNADNTSDVNKPVSTAVQALFDAFTAARRGNIFAHGGSTAPTGSFACNGQAISRTTYAALFAILGTAHGAGDGTTTFNVPDLRGEFLRGLDGGRGVDAGRVLGSTQAGQNASHTHGVNDPQHAHSVYDPGHGHSGATDGQGNHAHGFTRPNLSGLGAGSAGLLGNLPNAMEGAGTDAAGNHAHNISAYGSGTGIGIYGAATGISIQANGGNETRPRNVAVLYCIWY